MINPSNVQTTVAFKNMDSSDAVKAYVQKKAGKLAKHLQHLANCHFVLSIEKNDQVAQAHVVSGDFDAKAEARNENLYAAIDEVTDKLVHQSLKYKEKMKDHSGKGHHNNGT